MAAPVLPIGEGAPPNAPRQPVAAAMTWWARFSSTTGHPAVTAIRSTMSMGDRAAVGVDVKGALHLVGVAEPGELRLEDQRMGRLGDGGQRHGAGHGDERKVGALRRSDHLRGDGGGKSGPVGSRARWRHRPSGRRRSAPAGSGVAGGRPTVARINWPLDRSGSWPGSSADTDHPDRLVESGRTGEHLGVTGPYLCEQQDPRRPTASGPARRRRGDGAPGAPLAGL